MDDLAKVRELEQAVDKALLSPYPEVVELGREAQRALKSRKWDEAEKLLARAKDVPEPIKLGVVLLAHGFAKTVAQAQFLLNNRVVFVDGVMQRNLQANVRDARVLKVGDRVVNLKEQNGETA